MTLPNLENIIIAKPAAYQGMEVGSAQALLKAGQRVLGLLETAVVDRGYEQLKAKTGYTKENLPDESPKPTAPFALDNITFEMYTTVRRTNPKYQTAYDKIIAFVENIAYDWKEKAQKRGVRTYEDVITGNQGPFVRWDYFMARAYRYIGQFMELGVENKFTAITAPPELREPLDRLVIPVALMQDFDIQRPSAARLWYQACQLYADVTQKTVEPFRTGLEERAERAGEVEEGEEEVERLGRTERMPKETQEHWEQVADYLFKVQRVPSPRTQPGKALKRIFAIPERKEKGELPVVVTGANYKERLDAFRPHLGKSLPRWKEVEGHLGELVTFYYGVNTDPRVQEEFPYLPEYQATKAGENLFVRVRAVHARMKALEEDYTKNRLLTRHEVRPLV